MKTYTVTIKFKSDAPLAAIEHIAEDMRWQLDSLCDGSVDLGTQQKPDEVYATYDNAQVEVKEEDTNDT